MKKVSKPPNLQETNELIDDYMSDIYSKCISTNEILTTKDKSKKTKKLNKIDNSNIIIPTIYNYNILFEHNYNIQQLKEFIKFHKLKQSGNKNELLNRLHNYLRLSFYIIKIQKVYRGRLQRIYNSLHGPAYKTRDICTNANDFFTMDELSEIPNNLFFSYKDVDNFVYGFDVISLYNLIFKSGTVTKNPYNRNEIPNEVICNLKSFIRISRILNINLEIELKDDTDELSDEKVLELRTLSLFQNIDALGNYSSPNWFLSLNRLQTKRMIRELIDIWNYRAQITSETKCAICPPNGNLTNQITLHYIFNETNIHKIRKYIIEIFERLVNSGIDQDSKSLGAYYVLGALTLVNETAASSLPWLFQSFSYF
jgi:hypothetical protein